MRKLLSLASVLVLTACLETQTPAVIPSRPSTDFTISSITNVLKSPWSVAELPNGDILITEKAGRLRLISASNTKVDPIAIQGLPSDIFAAGQGGLLDVVISHDYLETREIYLSYAYGDDAANGTALLRATLNGVALDNAKVIFRANPTKAGTSHYGGKIVVLPDATLLLTLGDGFAYREAAQEPDTHLGKIIRVTRDGDVPSDNPFLNTSADGKDFKPEIYSLGHRNVQGLAYDVETGTLWETEHGPRGGDELNLIKASKNYGWPVATTGVDYQGARISPYQTFEGMVDPIYDWVPSIAPSGLAIYRGDMFPDWNGDALIGGLASRDLRHVDLENGKSVGETRLLGDLDARIRDVRVAKDGAILVLVEHPETGQLLRITPK